MENEKELREKITELAGKLNVLQKQYYELREENSKLKKELSVYKSNLKKARAENQEYKKQLQSSQLQKKQRQISDEQIEEIKKLRNQGLSFRAISKKTNWSVFTISRVLNGFYDWKYFVENSFKEKLNKILKNV